MKVESYTLGALKAPVDIPSQVPSQACLKPVFRGSRRSLRGAVLGSVSSPVSRRFPTPVSTVSEGVETPLFGSLFNAVLSPVLAPSGAPVGLSFSGERATGVTVVSGVSEGFHRLCTGLSTGYPQGCSPTSGVPVAVSTDVDSGAVGVTERVGCDVGWGKVFDVVGSIREGVV